MPRASVIIPTWNGVEILQHALASLARQRFRDFEVVVVDNGSTDGTLRFLRDRHPEVRVVAFPENRGFAVAANAGIKVAEGEVLVLMNNDIEADPEWIGALVGGMDRYADAGACASKMLSWADPSRIDSAGDDLGLFAYAIGHGQPDGPAFGRTGEVFSACAGAAAYRRSVLEEVGLFDERFFAYLEDVDLGARIQLSGWRCVYLPDAVVHHRGSATANRVPALKLRLLMRNSLIVFFRYMPRGILALWAPVILAWPFMRVLQERQPLGLAVRALGEFLRELPGVLRTRRSIRRSARISPREFRGRLAQRLLAPGAPSALHAVEERVECPA